MKSGTLSNLKSLTITVDNEFNILDYGIIDLPFKKIIGSSFFNTFFIAQAAYNQNTPPFFNDISLLKGDLFIIFFKNKPYFFNFYLKKETAKKKYLVGFYNESLSNSINNKQNNSALNSNKYFYSFPYFQNTTETKFTFNCNSLKGDYSFFSSTDTLSKLIKVTSESDKKKLNQKVKKFFYTKKTEAVFIKIEKGETTKWLRVVFDFSSILNKNLMFLSDVTTIMEKKEDVKFNEEILDKLQIYNKSGYWVLDPKKGNVIVSNALKNILEIDEIENNNFVELIDKFADQDHKNALLALIQNSIINKCSFEIEVKLITAFYNKKWIRIIGVPQIENGELFSLNGIITDITEFKSNQKILQKRNTQFETILEHNSQSYILLSLTDKIIAFNKYATFLSSAHFNLTLKLNDNILEKLREPYLSSYIESKKKCLLGNEINFYRLIETPDKVRNYYKVSYIPIKNSNKSVDNILILMSDVSQLKERENELQKLSLIASESTNGIYIVDHNRKLLWANKAYENIIEVEQNQLINKKPLLFQETSSFNRLSDDDIRQLAKGSSVKKELLLQKNNNSYYWANINITPILDYENNKQQLIIVEDCITDKNTIDEKLKQFYQPIQTIKNQNTAVLFIYNCEEKKLNYISNNAEILFEVDLKKLTDDNDFFLSKYLNKTAAKDLSKNIDQVFNDEPIISKHYKIKIANSQNEYKWISFSAVMYPLNKIKSKKIIGTIIDISEQKNAEIISESLKKIDEFHKKRLQKIRTISLLKGQENERKRISRELHDGIGQLLTATKLKLNYLSSKITDPEIMSNFKSVFEILQATIDETRRISSALAPITLYDFGIEAAIRELLNRYNNIDDMHITFESSIAGTRFPSIIEIELYRILSESINNSVKHSKASKLHVDLKYEDKVFSAVVLDNGIGFDFDEISKKTIKGHGIANIEERARIIQAEVSFTVRKNEGFILTLQLPITNADFNL